MVYPVGVYLASVRVEPVRLRPEFDPRRLRDVSDGRWIALPAGQFRLSFLRRPHSGILAVL